MIDKEQLRKKILESNSSVLIEKCDFSIFNDDDVDVFEKLVTFDNLKNGYYQNLSKKLQAEKRIVLKAVRCAKNIEIIPERFFEDKDIIKQILYARLSKLIPEKYLTNDIVNYIFTTSPKSSMEFKSKMDEFLKEETVLEVVERQADFFSDCYKNNSHPCIDSIYLPERMLTNKNIVKFLFIAQFEMIKNNKLIDEEMILDLVEKNYVIKNIPDFLLNNIEFIKKCIKKEHNSVLFSHIDFQNKIRGNVELTEELININNKILDCAFFPLPFKIFIKLVNKDVNNIFHADKVINSRKKLKNFLISKNILKYFKKESGEYDFSILYDRHYYYYKNDIVKNKYLIEEMAKQDHQIFLSLDSEVADDNELMYRIFFKHKVSYDSEENGEINGLYEKIISFGSLNKYLANLKLNYELNEVLQINTTENKNKSNKI